jgi:iron complex transport system ATP-binding protein
MIGAIFKQYRPILAAMDILKIRNADIYRGETEVFEDLSLSIPQGRNTAIIGPNGAGKTTLLKTIGREIYPHLGNFGSLEIFGQSTWKVWKLRKLLGIVSLDLQQDFRPLTTGSEVVRLAYYSSLASFGHEEFTDEQLANVNRLINQQGVNALRDKPFSRMSTGEQRRFLLARALVTDPKALILDEPTTGLDLPATFRYFAVISDLIGQGKTIVIVTHHLHEIVPEIDHVVLLKSGQILIEGPKEKVLTDQNLTRLFDVPIRVVCEDGYYRALPR